MTYPPHETDFDIIQRLSKERDELLKLKAQVEALATDKTAVWVNMLRGTIAIPNNLVEIAQLETVKTERDATKRHMDYCRSLLNAPSEEVLGELIVMLKNDNSSWESTHLNLKREHDELKAQVEALATDKNAVWANMLRGTIAIPSHLVEAHDYEQLKAEYSQITATNLNNVGDYEMQVANLRTELERETKWSREYFEKLERAEADFDSAEKCLRDQSSLCCDLTARLATVEAQVKELLNQRNQLNAKCAEMREAIKENDMHHVLVDDRGYYLGSKLYCINDRALSTDCGKPILEKMETMRCELVKAKCAEVKAILLEERVKRMEKALEKSKHTIIAMNGCYPLEYCSEETRYKWKTIKAIEQALETEASK